MRESEAHNHSTDFLPNGSSEPASRLVEVSTEYMDFNRRKGQKWLFSELGWQRLKSLKKNLPSTGVIQIRAAWRRGHSRSLMMKNFTWASGVYYDQSGHGETHEMKIAENVSHPPHPVVFNLQLISALVQIRPLYPVYLEAD